MTQQTGSLVLGSDATIKRLFAYSRVAKKPLFIVYVKRGFSLMLLPPVPSSMVYIVDAGSLHQIIDQIGY
jgi:hypothetical protein